MDEFSGAQEMRSGIQVQSGAGAISYTITLRGIKLRQNRSSLNWDLSVLYKTKQFAVKVNAWDQNIKNEHEQ